MDDDARDQQHDQSNGDLSIKPVFFAILILTYIWYAVNLFKNLSITGIRRI